MTRSLIVFTGLRLGSFNSSGFTNNFTFDEAPYICWTQAELTYSLIAATIPTARRLMLDFITYYNGGNFNTSGTRTGGSRSGGLGASTRGGEDIQMKSFRSKGRRKESSGLGYASGSQNHAVERDGEGVVSDGDSQEMIIRKDISIRVDNETGANKDRARPDFI